MASDYLLGGRVDDEEGFSPLAEKGEKFVMADQCPLQDECGAIRMKGMGTSDNREWESGRTSRLVFIRELALLIDAQFIVCCYASHLFLYISICIEMTCFPTARLSQAAGLTYTVLFSGTVVDKDGKKRGLIGSQFMLWVSETREYRSYQYTLVFGFIRQGLDFIRAVSSMERPAIWRHARLLSTKPYQQ